MAADNAGAWLIRSHLPDGTILESGRRYNEIAANRYATALRKKWGDNDSRVTVEVTHSPEHLPDPPVHADPGTSLDVAFVSAAMNASGPQPPTDTVERFAGGWTLIRSPDSVTVSGPPGTWRFEPAAHPHGG